MAAEMLATPYKALGVQLIQLLYFTDRQYNPADELRIAYNDPNLSLIHI